MQSSTSVSFGKRLAWEEPREFRKADTKACWKSTVRIVSLTIGAAIAFVCIARWFDLGAEVMWELLIAAGGIAIVCLLMMGHISRSVVKITDKAIVWDCGESPTVYRFGTIDHCEIRSELVEGGPMSVLAVELKNGDSETFGVAPLVSAEVLRSTLEQRGVNAVILAESAEMEPEPGEGSVTVTPQS